MTDLTDYQRIVVKPMEKALRKSTAELAACRRRAKQKEDALEDLIEAAQKLVATWDSDVLDEPTESAFRNALTASLSAAEQEAS